MKKYLMTTQFVIGDNEDVIEVADAWLKETAKEFEHPTDQFSIIETRTVRTTNDRRGRGKCSSNPGEKQ